MRRKLALACLVVLLAGCGGGGGGGYMSPEARSALIGALVANQSHYTPTDIRPYFPPPQTPMRVAPFSCSSFGGMTNCW